MGGGGGGGVFLICGGMRLGRGEGGGWGVMHVSVAVVSSDSQVDVVDRKFNYLFFWVLKWQY